MADRSINPDEHETTTTTTSPPPIDWLIMTLRVVQNPEDRQVNDVEVNDASSHPSSSSNTEDSPPENLVDDNHHNPSASHLDAAQTSQGGSSSGRAVDQVIERNENSEGPQELGHFKLPKSTASKLIQGGGVSQIITGNINKGKGQVIASFDIYDDDDDSDDDDAP